MKERLEHTFNEVVLIGEQLIFLTGLTEMLDRMGAFMHITRIGSSKDLNAYLQKKKSTDLVILVCPVFKSFKTSALNKFYKLNKNCSVMIMADDHELLTVMTYVKEGVKAAISKSCSESKMITALNCIYRNSFYFSPSFAQAVISKGLNSLSIKGKEKLIQISNREKEIIRLMWNDYTSKEIAESLNLSLRTIETHRNNIYEKLNVKTLGGIFKFGLESGIIF